MDLWIPITSGPLTFYVTRDVITDEKGIRRSVSAREAQYIADAFNAVLPTAKIEDLIWFHAGKKIAPILGNPAKTKDEEQSKAIDSALGDYDGLVSGLGKSWILSNKATPQKAVNYGWHTTIKAKSGGPWPSQTLKGVNVWQQPSTKHNLEHRDYSQLLRLVSRHAELNGEPVDMYDVLIDPILSAYVSDEGPVPPRQPGTIPNKPVANPFKNVGNTNPDYVGSIIAAPGIGRTSNAFKVRLLEIASKLGLDPDPIAMMISIESGFKPDAVNKISGATGISQSLPSHLKKAGYDPEDVAQWSALKQLQFVEKRYAALSGQLKTTNNPGDYYIANFLPAYIGKPDSILIGANPGDCKYVKNRPAHPEKASQVTEYGNIRLGAIYCGNYGFDTDKDGLFTLGDVRQFFLSRYYGALSKPRINVYWEDWEKMLENEESGAGDSTIIGIGSLMLVGIGLAAIWGAKT